MLAAVSPAVVVPSLLALDAQGYGVDKGIPTLVIAASSIDDVIAITGFGVVLGITFSTGFVPRLSYHNARSSLVMLLLIIRLLCLNVIIMFYSSDL